ncbi:hypothetical protein PC116_g19758 [Phytophthora cactorum]|uniref:Uncharacterized protein n=1 Tax=Phytophthora cactorum TaxID=29920 RepID=A0A8T0YUD1_9STRA|nr:hypothetical protein Pcac1_g3248 [Phytophthora cactorum]KAG2811299.1 hypothetical protein PC112_g15673 [Phytophthora cactorum]KAG2851633.1 hypothetical protein PC113_g15732 [Phytophthora cactorum]KAG2919775.1 hypothetical protein PC117_g16681 [Phytophthora cactorum]KAG2972467.1 hypothetical protein PC118_g15672 [Phytophthora cactorum]
MCFRAGIPFLEVESDSMKALLTLLRPTYAPHIPTAKTLSGSLLLRQYPELWDLSQEFIAGDKVYALVCDEWSNSRNEHQVSYIVLVPGQKSFFLKSVSTAGIPQTAERIAQEILKVFNVLGTSKCVV